MPWQNSRLRPAAHLHWAQVGDVVFLLDGHRGEYFGLDPHDSSLWLRLAGVEASDDEGSDASLNRLVEAATAKGWLVAPGNLQSDDPAFEPRLARAFRPLPVVDAYVCLIRAFHSLRHSGFSKTYEWARTTRLVEKTRTQRDVGAVPLERDLSTFSRAEQFVVSRVGFDDCLPRSLALYVFLSRAGIPVRHRIGVRRHPFLAHAWVEHNEVALLARAGSTADFVTLATIGH